MHKYIECSYLFTEVRKSNWNPKPEIDKKVKEALIKAPDRIKGALKQAKAELKKKASTFTSTLKTPPAFIKPSTFVIQYYSKPKNFILAHGKHYTSTPESHSQGTLYNSTDAIVTLEPISTDLNSLKITTQSVISLKSSAFKVTNAFTGQ